MNIDIDRAREIDTDAQIDALSCGQFVLVERDEPYTRATWHMDVADFITSDSPEENDELRLSLINALWWLDSAVLGGNVESTLRRGERVNTNLADIGRRVLLNAIANGITLERLGERTE